MFGREPAFWIGLIASVVTLAAQNAGDGSVVDFDWGNFFVALVPLLAALFTRTQVTPVADPRLGSATRHVP